MKQGWITQKLGYACTYIGRGISPKYTSDEKLKVINQKCIRDHQIDLDYAKHHDDQVKPVPKERLVKVGDVLVNSTGTGTLGRVAQVTSDLGATVDSHVTIVRPAAGLFDTKFFGYVMMSIEEELKKAGVGVGGQIELSRNKLKEGYDISYPTSLAEQQRIVSVLDEAFASIAQAKSNAERNLANSSEMFESFMNDLFENTSKEWKTEKLKKITTKIGSGSTPRGGRNSYQVEGLPLIRSLNVHDMGFKTKKLAFLNEEQADRLSNVAVKSGDVLLNITGASIARCCIVPDEVLPARVNQHVSIIRLVKDEMLPEFLHYALISKANKYKLLDTGEKGGATRQALTKVQIEEFSVSYPSTAEQRVIVDRLEELSTEKGRLENIYKLKVASLDELKKSMLHEAFAGKLA